MRGVCVNDINPGVFNAGSDLEALSYSNNPHYLISIVYVTYNPGFRCAYMIVGIMSCGITVQ